MTTTNIYQVSFCYSYQGKIGRFDTVVSGHNEHIAYLKASLELESEVPYIARELDHKIKFIETIEITETEF